VIGAVGARGWAEMWKILPESAGPEQHEEITITVPASTVNILTVPLQYGFYPPQSSPHPFSNPPSPPSSPTHRYLVHNKNRQKSERYGT
jgi:hypothetical protein